MFTPRIGWFPSSFTHGAVFHGSSEYTVGHEIVPYASKVQSAGCFSIELLNIPSNHSLMCPISFSPELSSSTLFHPHFFGSAHQAAGKPVHEKVYPSYWSFCSAKIPLFRGHVYFAISSTNFGSFFSVSMFVAF